MPQQQQKKPVNNTKSAPAAKPAATTEVRNSAVPPRTAGASGPAKKEISWNEIARRAYFIWQTRGGSEMENWLQAERELRGGR